MTEINFRLIGKAVGDAILGGTVGGGIGYCGSTQGG